MSMNIKSKRSGYTLVELMICVSMFIIFIIMGLLIYVAWHFISKFW